MTLDERDQGLAGIRVPTTWVDENVLTRDADGISEAIMLVSLGAAWTQLQRYSSSSRQGSSRSNCLLPEFFGSVLAVPQIVVSSHYPSGKG